MARNTIVFTICALAFIAMLFYWGTDARGAEPIAYASTDQNTEQCGESRLTGCTTFDASGCHVHVAAFAPDWVPDHEGKHCGGERHGAWVSINGRQCTEILEAGKTNEVPGMMLCVSDYRLVMVKP